MNPDVLLHLALDHHQELLRQAEEARRVALMRRATTPGPTALRVTPAAPIPSSLPCPTC